MRIDRLYNIHSYVCMYTQNLMKTQVNVDPFPDRGVSPWYVNCYVSGHLAAGKDSIPKYLLFEIFFTFYI